MSRKGGRRKGGDDALVPFQGIEPKPGEFPSLDLEDTVDAARKKLYKTLEGFRKTFESHAPGSVILEYYPSDPRAKQRTQDVCQARLGQSVADLASDWLSLCKTKPTTPLRFLTNVGYNTLTVHLMDTPQSRVDASAGVGEDNISYMLGFKESRKGLDYCIISHSDPSPQLQTIYKETLPFILDLCEKNGLDVLQLPAEAIHYGGVPTHETWGSSYCLKHVQERWDDVKGELPQEVYDRLVGVFEFKDSRDLWLIVDETFTLPDGLVLRDYLLQPFLTHKRTQIYFKDPKSRSRLDAWLKKP